VGPENYYDSDLAKAQDCLLPPAHKQAMTVKLLGQNDPRTGLVAQVIRPICNNRDHREISQVEPPVFQSDKTDPAKWDISLDAPQEGITSLVPGNLCLTRNVQRTTSNWFKDDQLQAVMDKAADQSTFTPETVDAAWQYIKDQVTPWVVLLRQQHRECLWHHQGVSG